MIAYGFREMMDAIRTGKMRTAMAITTISIAMLIFTGFLLISHNLHLGIDRFRAAGRLDVILSDSADMNALGEALGKQAEIASIRPYTKEQALEYFQQAHGASLTQGIRDALGASPFPSFLEVSLVSGTVDPQALVARVRALPGVVDVLYGRETVERLGRLAATTQVVAWTLGGVMAFFILLIVINGVRATVHARRADIYVLRLIGADDHTIRAPFLVEGGFLGLFGSLVGLALTFAAYAFIAAEVTFVPVEFLTPEMIGGAVLFAVALGMLGGILAVREAISLGE